MGISMILQQHQITAASNVTSRYTKKGKCLVVIRAGNSKGKIKLEVTSKKIKAQSEVVFTLK